MTLASVLFLFSCKKGSQEPVVNTKPDYREPLIKKAEAYFLSAKGSSKKVVSREAQSSLTKTALWEEASIAHYPKGDLVIVPISFDRNITLKGDVLGDSTVRLDRQTKLVMAKNADGSFKVEVYTHIPSQDYLERKTPRFSGILIKEDWEGTNRSSYLFRKGKYRKGIPALNRTGARAATSMTCTLTRYYDCQKDANGNYYDCIFLFSEVKDCYETEQTEIDWIDNSDGSGSGGGVTYVEEESLLSTKTVEWLVEIPANGKFLGTLMAYEKLNGNRFKMNGITHVSENCVNGVEVTHSNYAIWTKSFWEGTLIDGNKSARARLVGKLTFNNVPDQTVDDLDVWAASAVNW